MEFIIIALLAAAIWWATGKQVERKQSVNFDERMYAAYKIITATHGPALEPLNKHFMQIKQAKQEELNEVVNLLIQGFTFADDGIRLNRDAITKLYGIHQQTKPSGCRINETY